ncbi:MAG: CCA tRNA nucleotidyltransferase [Dehalococcoidales bacterium]|nr:CCA tRNA nucleotidyltransferase [Dehalococcoidales bacterium]
MELLIKSEESLFKRVGSFLLGHNIESYLVGGIIRDMLLGRETADIDIAIKGDSLNIAAQIAREIEGTFVLLDEENRVGRVVVTDKDSHNALTFDFTTLRGSIEEDLRERDFTIDALAIDISRISPESLCFNKLLPELVRATIIDTAGGLDDLHQGIIRAINLDVFKKDAVRLLRAVRLKAELDFIIETKTEILINRDCRWISGVSGERVREELLKMLAVPDSGKLVSYLDNLGILTVIIPELIPARDTTQPVEHYWNVLKHSLNTVIAVDYLLRRGECEFGKEEILAAVPWSENLANYFESEVGFHSTRATLLKIAALLHDIAKPQTKMPAENGRVRFLGHDKEGAEIAGGILERLRFSTKETRLVQSAVQYHMRPTQLSQGEALPSRRALYRYFRDTGEAGIDILYLSLADHLATRGPKLDISLWKEHTKEVAFILEQYYKAAETIKPVRLVDGNDLINIFGLKPGPEIGELLEQVKEASAAGEIKSREEALNYIRNILTRRTGK